MEIHVQLVKSYARLAEREIDHVVRSLCYGCSVDHPSQIQHDVCCMMEPEEQIQFCLPRALKRIPFQVVKDDLGKHLDVSLILKYPEVFNIEFHQHLLEKETFLEEVENCMCHKLPQNE